MKFSPRLYQRDHAVPHFINNDRSALWAKPGMGKSSSTLAALDALYMAGEDSPTLIVAPKRVALHTWPEEARKWDEFNYLETVPIIGTADARLATLKRDVPIHTINYENLPWLMDLVGDKWRWKTVVMDEASKVKNTRVSLQQHHKTGKWFFRNGGGSARASRFAQEIAFKHVTRLWQLTGSPAANGLKDIWGQVFLLDMGKRLGRSYTAFEDRWFHRVKAHRNDEYGELVPKPGAEEEIKRRIADICLSLSPEDWFPDLEAPLRFTVEVELPSKVRAIYDKMERELFADIGQHGVEAFNASSKTMKTRQIAAGFLFEQDASGASTNQFHRLHDEKLQALESIYNECGGTPILVAYWFKPDLKMLMEAFPKGADLSTTEGLRRFRAGDAPFGFGQPGSIGHGFDGLQNVTNVIAFYSTDYNLEYREQIIERIGPVRQLQSGHKRKVLIYDIVASGTTDEVLLEVLDTKCTVQNALFNAMKRRKTIA